METLSKTVSIGEAAQILNVSKNTLYAEAAQSGTVAGLPVVRVRNRILVSRKRLENLIDGQES